MHLVARDTVTGRFLPGESGNPSGPATGSISLTAILHDVLAENDPGKGRTWAEEIVRTLVKAAAKGDPRAIEFCFERVDGKDNDGPPAQTLATIAVGLVSAADEHRRARAADPGLAPGVP